MDTTTPADIELRAMKQLAGHVRSAGNKLVWRDAMQKRSTRIARALRILPKLTVKLAAQCTKIDSKWAITVPETTTPVLVLITRTSARTVHDLLQPLELQVLHTELVNIPRLRQLERDGLVRLVLPEATP